MIACPTKDKLIHYRIRAAGFSAGRWDQRAGSSGLHCLDRSRGGVIPFVAGLRHINSGVFKRSLWMMSGGLAHSKWGRIASSEECDVGKPAVSSSRLWAGRRSLGRD